jgi:tetratricopeptide (TPR) repeat protein
MGRALADDPAMRPGNGGSWLAALRAARLSVERTRRVRRVAGVAAAFLVLGMAVAAFATWRVWERQIPGGRPTVAVADFANETGDGELAGLSGLLTTSLEQGTQLRVLTRSRMLDVLRQLGKGAVDQIDETLAREVGRAAGAQVLLLASVRKLGESYVVEMRALDPLHDEYAFTVIERATGKEGIFDLVDRLGAATRRRLGDGGGTSPAPRKVASITTTNVKAWELLSRSRQALDGGRLDEAHRLAQGALEADPEFALARYQVAVVSTWGEDYMESRHSAPRDHVLAAERFADHLPEKERLSLKAMSAEVRSDWEEATRFRDQLVNDFPLDKEAVYWAGRARLEYGDVGASIPYLQRALQLDPFFSLAVDRLVAAFDASGRAAGNVDWLREQARKVREGFALRAVGRGLLAAGREQEALDVYRRAAAADGAPWPPADHVSYMAFDGRAAEAEGAARRSLAALTPGADVAEARPVRALRIALSNALLAQGRFAEYRAAVVDTFPDVSRDPMVRQWLGALARDRGSIRAATDDLDRAGALDMPLWGFGAAVNAAQAGEVSLAGPIARRVLASPRVGSLMPEWRRILGAVSSWERGFAAEAERELDAVGSHEFVGARYAAWLVLGELRRSRGDCGPAVAALEQARGVAWSGFLQERYGSHAGVLHSLAACYEKMGDLPKARERNDEMLRLWARADPDLPLLLEAKAMRERLVAAGR